MSTPPAAAPLGEAEARSQAKLAHILNGVFPLLGGLIIWLMNKDKSALVDTEGKTAVNFGFTLVAAQIASQILVVVSAGLLFIVPFGVWIWGLIVGIQQGNKVEAGAVGKYAFSPIQLIK